MSDTPRCEPPPEWRDRDGWHWIARHDGPMSVWRWRSTSQTWSWDGWASTPEDLDDDVRYVAPVTPAADVVKLQHAIGKRVIAMSELSASNAALRARVAELEAALGALVADIVEGYPDWERPVAALDSIRALLALTKETPDV